MPIQPSDIKLLESERMRDTADGGGRMTGNIIPSGLAGNVFPKVSRVDSVYGRVNLRKIYVAVRTATLDMYAGAHAIITDAPDNERIGCVLFSTASAFDTRTQARDRIESYVVAGPLSRMRLYGNQLTGQKAISCYQREEEPLPEVGEVVVLSPEGGGGGVQQYCRITDVSHEIRTFTDAQGDFRRRVVVLKIGAPLGGNYSGAEPTRSSADASTTKVRGTQVADASKYYGIQPLAEDAIAGALTLRLPSIYAPLVPSTQRESSVSLAGVAGATVTLSAGPAVTVSVPLDSGGAVAYAPRPIRPGTLSVSIRYTGPHSRDNGAGVLVSNTGGLPVGTVDYESGRIEVAGGGNEIINFTFIPAVFIDTAGHTGNIPVTLGTRGTVYTQTLNPLPAPGSLIVDYRALGRWYRLRDSGSGTLVANSMSEGVGVVDYVTGAVVVTLGALPDVGSAVLFSWASPVHYTARSGVATDAASSLQLDYAVEGAPVVPGSVVISYPVAGVARNLTDPSANGVLTGVGASGTINYATGEVRLTFASPPDRGSLLQHAYTKRVGSGLLSGTTAVISGGQFTVPGAAPFRNSGRMTFSVSGPAGPVTAPAYITNGGEVRVRGGGHPLSSVGLRTEMWIDQAVGTFNAATGVVTLTNGVSIKTSVWEQGPLSSSGWPTGSWHISSTPSAIVGVTDIAVERDTEAYDPAAVTGEGINPSALGLKIDLTNSVGDPVVPGSVWLVVTGKEYVDRSGTLYSDIDPSTGSGVVAGTVDYSTGVCTLTYWANGVSVTRAVKGCLTTYGNWTANTAHFRTAGSPVRAASFYVQATAADGELLTGTSNQSGGISGSDIRGQIEQDVGVVSIEFGRMEAGAWVPREVIPSTLRSSLVVLTNLPLEANILGLDPVRLPSDGRVPIYRTGDVVVIHNTQLTALPNPVVAGTTYSVGRSALATLVLEDAAGESLPADRYLASLEAGTVEIAADWNGDGVLQPLAARHRVEDMALLADAQINGQIDLTAPTLHDYPAASSFVSSALLFGDLQAFVTGVFDQSTWTGVWSDVLIGSQAAAQYNDIDYPIEVLNQSAVTERWRVNFTATGTFQVIGENLGVIATGSTSTDFAPVNTLTGLPYFVIRAAGWGLGWSAGVQLRFNTIGANGPIWVARTILAGASLEGDSFDIEARGDVD